MWAACISCFFLSTLAHISLLLSGGAIPASRYISSMIDLHALFISGSSLEACGDLVQLGMHIQPRSKTAPMLF